MTADLGLDEMDSKITLMVAGLAHNAFLFAVERAKGVQSR